MSELMNVQRRNIRWELLTTVSALALLATVCGSSCSSAADQDTDRPTVWIELGAQSEQVSGFGAPFTPPFASEVIADGFASPIQAQRALSQSFGGNASISFQPKNSDWIFSVSALYGRANGHKGTHEQTPGCQPCYFHVGSAGGYLTVPGAKFSEPSVDNNESHTILDFQVGRDIGLGLFSSDGKSSFGFGVRFAQFTSKHGLNLNADPDRYFATHNIKYAQFHHTYAVTSHMDRSFRGLGPSISWSASAPVIGKADDGGLSLDWGVNAAVLFGRQKASGHHQTAGTYYKANLVQKYHFSSHIHRSGNPERSRTVIVPDVGGFAGASFNFFNARVSLGYRADFFFGAMDVGIDAHKSATLGFYGPFASIGVGLGG
jgi:iron complex outermembrane receptor protein